MSSLSKCPACSGVVPVSLSECPHCEGPLTPKSSLGKLAMGLLGGLGASMTLMACYGAPATGCRSVSETLPDGGLTSNYRCPGDIVTQPDGGTTIFTEDSGAPTDAGASDGGSRDGGADGGP
ncbi:MAG: hypothetical protein Q8L14_00445 [Myxococcales bacterium]|nr:hypothetical protein [Myxococcales bacterium]